MEYEIDFLDEKTILSIKKKFKYLNNHYNLYCQPDSKLELRYVNYGYCYVGNIYIQPDEYNILLRFIIRITPYNQIEISFNEKTPLTDFLINWVYFMTYNIVSKNGSYFLKYIIKVNEIPSVKHILDVETDKHIKKMNQEFYLRKYFIESCKKIFSIGKQPSNHEKNNASMITGIYRYRKQPHELTKQFKPKTILKLKSSSSQTKKLYKKRYGINLASNQNRFKTTKRISRVNSDMRSKLRKYAELPRKYSLEVESETGSEYDYDDFINIGLLIITAHGLVEFTDANIPIIDIPPEIENTYYKSSSKPGCGSFRPFKSSLYNKYYGLEQIRNNIEKCFRETVNKKEFSKYFFECDTDRHKLYMSKKIKFNNLSSLDLEDMYKPIVYNGKVKKLLNKSFSTKPEEDTDELNPHNQIIFILEQTLSYNKYNLLDLNDIRKLYTYIKTILSNQEKLRRLDEIYDKIQIGLTRYFAGTNHIKKINIKDILTLLSFLELEDLYIYDDSCSSFFLPEDVIEDLSKDGKTIDEVHRELSNLIHKEAPIQKIGI